MKNLLKSNVNWLVFLMLGMALHLVVFLAKPENKYPAMTIGFFLLGMGIFLLCFPDRRLFWLQKDHVNLLTAGFVGTFIILTLLLFMGQLIG